MRLSLAVLFCISIFSANIYSQTSTDDFFENGVKKLKSQDFIGALQDFNKSLELNPSNAKAYNNRGIIKSGLNDFVGSIDDFSKAIALDPYNISAYRNRGLSNYKLKNYKAAINDFNKVLQFKREDEIALKNIELSKKELQAKIANDYIQELERKKSQLVEVDSGFFKGEKKNIETKKTKGNKLVLEPIKSDSLSSNIVIGNKLKGGNNKTLNDVGKPLKNESSEQKVDVEHAEKRLQSPSFNSHSYADLIAEGDFKMKTFYYKSAFESYTKAIDLDTNNALGYYKRAVLKANLKGYLGILDEKKSDTKISKKYDDAFVTNELSKGDYGALEDFTKAIQLNPLSDLAYFGRGKLLYGLKQYKSAVADFGKSLEINSKNADAYYYRGLSKGLLNDMNSACFDFIKSAELGNTDALDLIKECK